MTELNDTGDRPPLPNTLVGPLGARVRSLASFLTMANHGRCLKTFNEAAYAIVP